MCSFLNIHPFYYINFSCKYLYIDRILLKAMIDKNDFKAMRLEFEKKEKTREEVIVKSREALKLSKHAIYSLHRDDVKEAKSQLAEARKIIALVSPTKDVGDIGIFGEACEEFVEALSYYTFITESRLLTRKESGVDMDYYLPGICDLVGELVRKAINSCISADYASALKIRDFVSDVYAELLLFDFPNIPVRRKFDGIKYGLEKLEDLVLKLKLEGKI